MILSFLCILMAALYVTVKCCIILLCGEKNPGTPPKIILREINLSYERNG